MRSSGPGAQAGGRGGDSSPHPGPGFSDTTVPHPSSQWRSLQFLSQGKLGTKCPSPTGQVGAPQSPPVLTLNILVPQIQCWLLNGGGYTSGPPSLCCAALLPTSFHILPQRWPHSGPSEHALKSPPLPSTPEVAAFQQESWVMGWEQQFHSDDSSSVLRSTG